MVVKSATKKKLMDLGIMDEYAHVLADDRKWDAVCLLTWEEIKSIIIYNITIDTAKDIWGKIHMNEQTTDKKQVSQKAQALDKLTKGKDAGILYAPHWKTLQTIRMELEPMSIVRDAMIDGTWIEMTDIHGHQELFVRACPLTPRAGVLESSVANNLEEMREIVHRIMDKMLGADPSSEPLYEHGLLEPDGCIIVQPYIDATASAVASPSSHIVMARDNDGVTAGKDGLKVALRHTGYRDEITAGVLDKMKIDPTKIELEFVATHGGKMRGSHSVKPKSHIVQLRGAEYGHTPLAPPPAGVSISGFVTGGTMTVKEVYTIADSGDEELARLEEHLRENDVSNTAFIHADSSSLSHHAGQCRKYNAGAYINSNDVSVGDTWVECAAGWVIDDPNFEAKPFNHMEYIEDYAAGIQVGLLHFARQYGWLSNHFHQFLGGAPLMDIKNTAYLAGVFTGYLPNAIMAVSLGEFRHARGQKTNYKPIDAATFGVLYDGLQYEAGQDYSHERKSYYATIEETPITGDSITGQLKWLSKMYANGWSGGYGGTKYKESTDKGVLIMEAIKKFSKSKTQENLTHLMGMVNDGENIVHNNGFFLDKFIHRRAFDIGTDPDALEIIPRELFSVYYAALDAVNNRDSLPTVVIDNSRVSAYGIKYNKKGVGWLNNNPLFLQKDLPTEYLRLTDLSFLHRHPQHILCGHTECGYCLEHIKANITTAAVALKINTYNEYDMESPTNTTEEEEIHLDVDAYEMYLNIFKNEIYDESLSQSILHCLNTVLNIPNNNPMVNKLRKHYAFWLANAPVEYLTSYTEMATPTQEE